MNANAKVKGVSVSSIGGGLSGIGNKNCYLLTVEYENIGKLGFLFDCGQAIPEWDEDRLNAGLDWNYVPNFSAIPQDVDRIVAVFVSHAHRDHDGGLNKFFEFLINSDRFSGNLPEVFMPQYAANMQRSREYRALNAKPPQLDARYAITSHKKFGITNNIVTVVDDTSEIIYGFGDNNPESDIAFSFFKVPHSVSDSLGIMVGVAGETIIYSGDLRLQGANQQETFAFIRTISSDKLKNPTFLMLDATGADKEGPGKAEDIAIDTLLGIIDENPDKRIFATMFSSQPKLFEFLKTFERMGLTRQVVLHGGSMQDNIKWGHGLRPLHDKAEFSPGGWKRYSYGVSPVSANSIIFLTGSQAEPLSALSRLLNPEYNEKMQDIHLTPNDIVVFAARTIPGNEPQVSQLLQELRKIGCVIYYPINHDSSEPEWVRKAVGDKVVFDELHVSGHAPLDDLRQIIDILKPKKLMPIHASLGHRALMADMMENSNDILLPNDLEEVVIFEK